MKLTRRPRPRPLVKGTRPYPWLAVNPLGHEEEGYPVVRDARCNEPTGEAEGAICDRAFEQQQIDPEWLAKKAFGVQAAFMRQVVADSDGSLWVPCRCPGCEHKALDREAGVHAPVSSAWWAQPEASTPRTPEIPTQDELFGGI